ncbi:holo-ACP synthase [Oceanobacillus jordanicus]|uniref:Holo-[acyl-carrier-protein] synthase n=1 Tax=Oceanobacillus jordanicus TaxID=2867266 RepID=A0AAW5BFJ5_9BACI|nr:holo-ACP synthase [Oceanobacillus jordanicus]MCG3421257.1 holo-ACP synthase [Oceanobacillus jordanicus]
MIKGIGIDLIELDRIAESLQKGDRLAKRVLTNKELDIFNSLPTDPRRVEFLAGRFAAKEAFAKATGTGIGKLSFRDMEVLPQQSGAPSFHAPGYSQDKIFISITHSRDYAAAQVVIEADNDMHN